MKLILITLGCHKNLVDSENLLGIAVNKLGMQITTDINEADIAIINTCGFINDAKQESIEKIIEVGNYKNQPNTNLKKVIVAGCLAQRYASELMDEISEIDGIIGTGDIDKLVEIVEEIKSDKRVVKSESLEFLMNSDTDRVLTTYPHTAYIKIAEGCDNRCTYCVIPYLRGKFRSRKIEDIISEVDKLSENGVKEISIIAQDTTEYGIDIYGKRMLASLLKRLSEIEKLEWIRVFYTYPNNYDDELITEIKTNNKICKYIDIPIQHISTSILKRMGRRGSGEETKKLLSKLRKEIPEAVFRTSLIVGFPGETEEEYNELTKFVEEFKFDYAGIFSYSREEGTPAFDLNNQIDDEVKAERRVNLINLQNKIAEEKNKKYIGEIIDVIVDGVSEESEFMLEGRARFQALEIDGKILINDGTAERGEIVKVKIEQNFDYDLLGAIVDESTK